MQRFELKQYLDSHPDASLKEYLDYLENESKIKLEEAKKLETEKEEWYKNLENKYFKVTHNATSFGYFYISEVQQAPYRAPVVIADIYYSILSTEKLLRISEENRNYVNHLWFGCPYENGAVDLMTEISRQEFEDKISKIKGYIKNFEI